MDSSSPFAENIREASRRIGRGVPGEEEVMLPVDPENLGGPECGLVQAILFPVDSSRHSRTMAAGELETLTSTTSDHSSCTSSRCDLIYYFQEFARGATIFMYHNDRFTVGIAAHQAARKGRPLFRASR
jgi:hypothetical protein